MSRAWIISCHRLTRTNESAMVLNCVSFGPLHYYLVAGCTTSLKVHVDTKQCSGKKDWIEKKILAGNFVFERKGTGNRNCCSLQSSKLWTPWQLIIPSSFLAQLCVCSVFVVTTVCFRMNLPCFQLSSGIFWTVYTVTIWHCPHSAEPHRDWACGLY